MEKNPSLRHRMCHQLFNVIIDESMAMFILSIPSFMTKPSDSHTVNPNSSGYVEWRWLDTSDTEEWDHHHSTTLSAMT